MNVMCEAKHECTGGREGQCTRLAHTGSHHCVWCGQAWGGYEGQAS